MAQHAPLSYGHMLEIFYAQMKHTTWKILVQPSEKALFIVLIIFLAIKNDFLLYEKLFLS